jgi:thiosulfate reductase cytochrome b subunit
MLQSAEIRLHVLCGEITGLDLCVPVFMNSIQFNKRSKYNTWSELLYGNVGYAYIYLSFLIGLVCTYKCF